MLRRSGERRLAFPDLVVMAMVAVLLLLWLLGLSLGEHVVAAVTVILVPFLLGRRLGSPEYRASVTETLAVAGTCVAALGLIEFLLDFHPFQGLTLGTGPDRIWSPIQYRAGFPRSELGFGHSIAYGNFVAICVPFAVMSRRNGFVRAGMIAVMMAGICVSFSRNAILAGGIALVLAIVLERRASGVSFGRVMVLGVVGLLAAVTLPVYFDAIGSRGELASSSAYRSGYLTVLGDIRAFGLAADIYTHDSLGRFAWLAAGYPGGKIVTLDSTPLLWALQFGWIVLGLFLLFLLWSGLALVRRPSAATIALVSQTITIATVAPITQYPYLYWLIAGIAVSWACNHRLHRPPQPDDDATARPPMTRTGR